jgi:hypothetical protein
VHRLVAFALLAAWLAPGLLALATSLHVGLHHPHAAAEAAGWLVAVEHGHSHAVGDAEHEHPGTPAERLRAAFDPRAAGVAAEAPTLPAVAEPAAAPEQPPPLRPPRPPLYSLHCALLR